MIEQPIKLRIKFTKDGDMRWLSQLDIARTLVRVLRRAKIPILFTSGFSPHPKISFGPALALGISSAAEYCDVSLDALITGQEALSNIRPNLPPSINVTAVAVTQGSSSLGKIIKRVIYRISGTINTKVIDDKMTSGRFLLTIEGNKTNSILKVDESIEVRRLEYLENIFSADIATPVNTRPRSIVEAIEGRAGASFQSFEIRRIAQIAVIDGLEVDPVVVGAGGAIVETDK